MGPVVALVRPCECEGEKEEFSSTPVLHHIRRCAVIVERVAEPASESVTKTLVEPTTEETPQQTDQYTTETFDVIHLNIKPHTYSVHQHPRRLQSMMPKTSGRTKVPQDLEKLQSWLRKALSSSQRSTPLRNPKLRLNRPPRIVKWQNTRRPYCTNLSLSKTKEL